MTPAELRPFVLASAPGTVIPVPVELLKELLDGKQPTPVSTDHDYTVAEAAGQLRVTTKTVTRWLTSGKLRGRRLPRRGWRIPPGSLDELTP